MMHKRIRRIFIGSSSESKPLAEKIRNQAKSTFEFITWYDHFFDVGSYVFLDLIKKSLTFDYAVMIGGKDDKVTRLSTNQDKLSPRDNIYIEYGLFSGILSSHRVLLLLHQDCEIASDLAGMTLKRYSSDEEALALYSSWIDQQVRQTRREFAVNEIELLPTVGISVGYFHNFVKPFVSQLRQLDSVEMNGGAYEVRSKRLTIYIPDFVCDAVSDYQTDLILRRSLQKAIVANYRVLYDPEALERQELNVFDIPSTLLAVYKTVDYIFGLSDGNNADTICAKQRALDNFFDNLNTLIQNDFLVRRLVSLERYSDTE